MDKKTLKEIALEQSENDKQSGRAGNIKRDILDMFSAGKTGNHAVIISGIRRCGKSTLMGEIKESYIKSGFYSFSFEDERLMGFEARDFNALYEVLMENFGDKKTFFLDEIQNVDGWEAFVRRLQDSGYKFFITGSNASLLGRELGTKLTGRNLRLELYPFSFREYLRFAGVETLAAQTATAKNRAALKRRFEEWLKHGGMPEFLKYGDTAMLRHVYDDILYRDIAARYGVKQIKALRELALYFMSNIGGMFTYNSAAKFLKLGSMNTVKNFADYMENSYLIFLTARFSYSLKQQFVSEKKIYCVDNGIAESVAFRFSPNRGRYLENAVYMELRRRGGEIYYYKTKKGMEVDFLVRKAGRGMQLFQSCAEMENPATKERETEALKEAMKELKVKKATIITEDEAWESKFKGGVITAVPAHVWMLGEKEADA